MNLHTPALPHREFFPTHQRVYWKGNAASDILDADLVILEIPTGVFGPARLEFAWPDGRQRLSKTEDLLRLAFDLGRADKLKEIKQVLGVVDPRA